MSDITPNFNLFKYDTVADSQSAFSITRALNNNWDLLDANCVKRESTDAATGSPTRPVYVDEKGQIQACSKDLLDDGYLSATVLLDENGYIKFSNTLILSWMAVSGTCASVTYPIAYSKVFTVYITAEAASIHDTLHSMYRDITIEGLSFGLGQFNTAALQSNLYVQYVLVIGI